MIAFALLLTHFTDDRALFQNAIDRLSRVECISYKARSKITDGTRVFQDDGPEGERTIHIQRFGLIREEIPGHRIVFHDGKTMWIVAVDQYGYQTTSDLYADSVPVGMSQFPGFEGVAYRQAPLPPGLKISAEKFDGRECIAATFPIRAGFPRTLYIDRHTLFPAGYFQHQTTGQSLDVIEIYRDVKIVPPLSKSSYSWKPAEHFVNRNTTPELLAAGTTAPDFTLSDTEGRKVTLSNALKGKRAVLLDFYFVQCLPCQESHPHLQSLVSGPAGRDLLVLGIDAIDGAKAISKYRSAKHLTFPTLLAKPDTIASFRAGPYPTVYLIGPGRKVLFSQRGGSRKSLDAALRAAGIQVEER